MSKKFDASDEDQRMTRSLAVLAQERMTGPPQASQYPQERTSECHPFVEEMCLFVPACEVLYACAESFSDIKLDTVQQATRASGIAAWLDVVNHPLAGKVVTIDHGKMIILPSDTYNMAKEQSSEVRPKTVINMIAIPYDADKPPTPENLAGILFRAMSYDPDYSFADALALTLQTNKMICTGTMSSADFSSEHRRVLTKLYSPPANALVEHEESLNRQLVYDIVRRPEHYRPAVMEWVEQKRSKLVKQKAEELERKALKQRQRLIKERAARLRAKAKAAKGKKEKSGEAKEKPADDKEEDDNDDSSSQAEEAKPMEEGASEDEDDPMATELSPDELATITLEASRIIEEDTELPINVFANILSITPVKGDSRRHNSDCLVRNSVASYARSLIRDRSATEPATPAEYLDTMCFRVSSLSRWVKACIMYAHSDEEMIRECLKEARVLESRGFDGVAIAKSCLSPTKIFTLESQLERAVSYGGAKSVCEIDFYYTCHNSSDPYGPRYDPDKAHSTLTFEPLGIVPDWGRTLEERSMLISNEKDATDATLSPYVSRVDINCPTWTIPHGYTRFEQFRTLRLPFTESLVPKEIDVAYRKALQGSQLQRQISNSIGVHLAALVEDDHSGANIDDASTDELVRVIKSRYANNDALELERVEFEQQLEFMANIGFKAPEEVLHPEAKQAREEIFSQLRQRQEEQTRLLEVFGETDCCQPPRQPDVGRSNHYRSNFTILREILDPLRQMMRELAHLDPGAFAILMPKFRAYCLGMMARTHLAGAFNNGVVMRAVRDHDRENWHDTNSRAGSGAYQRLPMITADLSWFANTMLSDMLILKTMRNITVGGFVLVDMLATRAICGDNLTPKINQLLISRAGDGKSYLMGVFMDLSLAQSTRTQTVTSSQANIDPQANDDLHMYMDEAPTCVTESRKHSDPKVMQAEDIMRQVTGSGVVGSSRSYRGLCTISFSVDHHVTFYICTNIAKAPPNFEMSMYSRFETRRLPDQINTLNQLYSQHAVLPAPISARIATMRRKFRNEHALMLLVAKAYYVYALPEPDTSVVSCLLSYVMSRVDLYYPRWHESMRASRRVQLHARGYAVKNAISLIFSSAYSKYSPENNKSGYNPGFDIAQLTPCAPFLCATTEMFMLSLLWVLDEALCTEAHLMMYALATKQGFCAKAFERLFFYGGVDHRASITANTRANTMYPSINKKYAVTPDMLSAFQYAKKLKALNESELLKRHQRDVAVRVATDGVVTKEYNRFGEVITEELRVAIDYEAQVLDWYNELDREAKEAIEASSKSSVPSYIIGGWKPSHWDRTPDAMPESWKIAEQLLRALEQRNNPCSAANSAISFIKLSDTHGYDPNYIRVDMTDNRDLTAAIEQALGAYTISRTNMQFMTDVYLKDRKAVTAELPQLATVAENTAINLKWLCNSEGIIVTKRIPFVRVNKTSSIDISTVWLFCGAYHNHVMDMFCSLEDCHVPPGGRNMITPFSHPAAPEVLLPFRLQPRPGRVITVTNPEYMPQALSARAMSALPCNNTDVSLYSILEQRAESGSSDNASVMDGVTMRAASATADAIAHGVTRECNTGQTVAESKEQIYLMEWRLRIEDIKREHRERCAEAIRNRAPLPELVLPPQPDFEPTSDQRGPLNFFSPHAQQVSFTHCSIDEQLSAVFLARTGQSNDVRPHEVERALVADSQAVSLVVRQQADAVREYTEKQVLGFVSAKKQEEMVKKFEAVQQPLTDEDPDAPAIKMLGELINASEALSTLSKQHSRVGGNYPATFTPTSAPAWMGRNEQDAAALLAKQKAAEKDGDNASKLYIKPPPEWSPEIRQALRKTELDIMGVEPSSNSMPGEPSDPARDTEAEGEPMPVDPPPPNPEQQDESQFANALLSAVTNHTVAHTDF